jgi:hypothetical protein
MKTKTAGAILLGLKTHEKEMELLKKKNEILE